MNAAVAVLRDDWVPCGGGSIRRPFPGSAHSAAHGKKGAGKKWLPNRR